MDKNHYDGKKEQFDKHSDLEKAANKYENVSKSNDNPLMLLIKK